MKKIRVLIADDHAIVRDGLQQLIKSQSDLEAAGEAEDGDQNRAHEDEGRPAPRRRRASREPKAGKIAE